MAKDPVLVVLQLSGGNDYINTVIPYANSLYWDNRPAVNIPEDKVIALDDKVGFNPSMAPLKKIYDEGKMAVIVELLQWGHAGVEAHLVIQGNDLVFGNVHRRAVVPIQRVGVRDDRVHVIIPTTQLQNDQNRIFCHGAISLHARDIS